MSTARAWIRAFPSGGGGRADERIPLEDLYGATEVMALALFDLPGTRK